MQCFDHQNIARLVESGGMRMTEKELLKRSREGHVSSFEELISAHQQKVYNIALRMLANEQDAFDASQEVFIKVYKNLDKFQENSSFSTWLYRITTNTCLDMLRKNKDKKNDISIDSQIAFEDGEASFQLEDKSADLEEEILKKERQQALYDAIEQLNEEHKKMIVLRDLQGMSYQEIAAITGTNIGTVKSKINRARISLKNSLLKYKELF